MKRSLATLLAFVFLCALAVPSSADEGMWTFDAFPSAKVKAAYGFEPTQAFLDHVRLSSLRIAGGCSASFVSPDGLVMTNHHCAVECAEQLSTPGHDYVSDGFYAATLADERACPDFELDQLEKIDDVSSVVKAATANLTGAAFNAAERAARAKLSASCGTSAAVRCDVVNLYHGGEYKLYHYRRYNDVRLAFAPEFAVAQFGGDPDNFNFPRYDFDIAILRAYVDGKPAVTPDHLTFDVKGSTAGELVFVSGNPGGTSRELTVSQLSFERDVQWPNVIPQISEERGVMEQYATEGAEQARDIKDPLFYLENDYKVIYGRENALLDPAFFATKVTQENDLRAKVAADPALAREIGDPWATIVRADERDAQLYFRNEYVANGPYSQYFDDARTLVRLPVETAKPNGDRLPQFAQGALDRTKEALLAPIPIYPGNEELALRQYFLDMRRDLGTDDAFVRKVLGKQSPAELAHALVSGTKLGDVAYRKQLLDGGAPAIAASTDPMIRFVASIDPDARAAYKTYQDEVTAPTTSAEQQIARARFAIYGTSIDPDATFTARLSYGAVKGFVDQNGQQVAPYTTMAGLFARATGAPPYALPQSWLDARSKLTLSTPMNLCTTNDIIGGNSGSPLINQDGQVVGLIFDGNIFSLGGDYGYDGAKNRAVALDVRAIVAGLHTVYHADRLLDDISKS